MILGFKQGPKYLELRRQAEDATLLVAPPYSDPKARKAFVNGYETALSDIANGNLKLPGDVS